MPTSPAVPADACHAGGLVYCALDPRVTAQTVKATICSGHWSSTVRPPANVTGHWKARDFIDLPRPTDPGTGQPITSFSQTEGDHRLSLGLGGDPGAYLVNGSWQETTQVVVIAEDRLPQNFSLEWPASTNPKDSEELKLHNRVCAGTLTLAAAQQQLVTDWLGPFPSYTH